MTSLPPQAPPADASSEIEVPWSRVERFVAQLTHDVRNGLNALELQLTFLGEISTDPEAVEEVKLIRKTVADITRQLQAVRNATGPVGLNTLDYPATDFFEDLRERFERNEPASKHHVQWQVEVGATSLSIDPDTTMAALLELIANALHHGDPQYPAVFSASTVPGRAVVVLREPAGAPPKLEAAHWGRQPLLSHRRGTYGLGLFRARRIIEAQGGSFESAYSAEEKTLTTTVTLPVSRVP